MLAIDRRTFLKAAGLAAGGLAGAERVLGGVAPLDLAGHPPAALADDPIASLASALEYDLEAMLRFVADEVAYEPYAGVLRGADATLAGRAGNAADKSVLLAALLDASGIAARYVMGALDATALAELGRVTVDPDEVRQRRDARGPGADVADGSLPPAVEPPPELETIASRLPEIDASVTAWAGSTLDATTTLIVNSLADAGIALPGPPDPIPAMERDRHVWVQARSGSDWLDLDPTLAGSEVGRTLASIVGEPLDVLPDDMRHRVDLAIVAERISGSALTREVLIDHSAFADDLTDVPISVGHAKPDGLRAVGVALEQAVAGGVRYVPILRVGDTATVATNSLLLSGAGGGDPFDVGGTGPREGEATAEWLEVTLTRPDGRTTTARRALFDRIGEPARQAGAVDIASIPAVALVDLGPDLPDEYPPLGSVHLLSVATSATQRPTLAGITDDLERDFAALGLPATLYHRTRDTTDLVLGPPRGLAVHLDAPNVSMYSYGLDVTTDGAITIRQSIDLLHRSFATRPVVGATATLPPGLLAGVASHVAERLRMGDGLPPDLAPAARPLSAGALVEQAVAQGVGVSVLRDRVPDGSDYPPEARLRLAEALGQGWVAIAPREPVMVDGHARLGWWLVDPATGATVDMLDDGRGVTLVEWAIVVVVVATAAAVFLFCREAAASRARFNEWAREMNDLNHQLGADVADIPSQPAGTC